MGLLDKLVGTKEEESELKKKVGLGSFSVQKTNNVPKLLKETALMTGIPVQRIDFDIVLIKTEVKLPGSNEYEDLKNDILTKIKDENLLLDNQTVINQSYELSLREMSKNAALDLIIQISANKTYSAAKAVIKKESVIHYNSNLPSMLLKELNKKKIRNGMLINLYDERMRAGIKDLATKIRINDRLLEDFELELCRWPEPIPTRNDRFVYIHEERRKKELEEKNLDDKIDYSDRDFLTTIEPGEIALEYIKPKLGRPGRNFKGKYVPALEPRSDNEPKFIVDVQSIEARENEDKIFYIAKTKGYVKIDDKELRIADKLEISEATFRSTGNINAELDKDIKIDLKSKNKHEDNVGPNTKISASEINVEGSVASGAQLRAESIVVKGQTHKASKIYANNATIGLHKGFLCAKNVQIEKLENGEVIADNIKVEQAIGGTLKGKYIEINELFSNVRMIASKEIRITGDIKGSDNHFIIEPAVTVDEKERLGVLLTDVKELEKKVKNMQKSFLLKKDGLKQTQDSAAAIKEIIMDAKKNGRKPSQIHIDRYKQLMENMQEAKNMKEELEDLEDKLEREKDEISIIQDAAIRAKIVNMNVWHTHNKVFYKLIQPEMKIEYIPKIGMSSSELTLKMVGEDEYEVEVKYL